MIPVATEKARLPDDWSILGAAVFAGIGVVGVRPHLYSFLSSPQVVSDGGVVAGGWWLDALLRDLGSDAIRDVIRHRRR